MRALAGAARWGPSGQRAAESIDLPARALDTGTGGKIWASGAEGGAFCHELPRMEGLASHQRRSQLRGGAVYPGVGLWAMASRPEW